jgi:hypothetical protein
LRATGFLVRNYKMLSREQWLEDTVKHTSQAFLGVTMGCAKCHDHMYDPISQEEYFQMRALFEPHQVRIDRVPGQADIKLAGLARTFDTATNQVTYFYIRGDERTPDTNRIIPPGVPKALAGNFQFAAQPVSLPREAFAPDQREFVYNDLIRAAEESVQKQEQEFTKLKNTNATAAAALTEAAIKFTLEKAKRDCLVALLKVERMEDSGTGSGAEWEQAAREAHRLQRLVEHREAELKLHQSSMSAQAAEAGLKAAELAEGNQPNKPETEKSRKALEAARKKLEEAQTAYLKTSDAEREVLSTAYKPRTVPSYPKESTGRRLAFAQWLTNSANPLTARVAVNHIWLRHFGRGIVPTPNDFGANGGKPSHPELLDHLAAEFMRSGWSMKKLHRLIVTSSTYKSASTPDAYNAEKDPDNIYLWRMPSRRMEAEVIRDNLLHLGGSLDLTMGGPEIDHKEGLISKRRSIYLRQAAEKEVEFLKIFDGPEVTECYQRRSSVMPQQALALANSKLALGQARQLTSRLAGKEEVSDDVFIEGLFRRVLCRSPRADELELCLTFLKSGSAGDNLQTISSPARRRENLALVLLNHNDFLTVR